MTDGQNSDRICVQLNPIYNFELFIFRITNLKGHVLRIG